MNNFAIIGVAGYIAPKHLEAIKNIGGNLLAALDPSDSVGILDQYFSKAAFFTEFERFDRHLEKLQRSGIKIDYLVVCSPNYLHDAHSRYGLRMGINVICEKPLALNPWNVDQLAELEKETGKKINNILQLRLHPELISLKQRVLRNENHSIYKINLTYITSRGSWYYASWKANEEKSGGIVTNIGIHFFDVLISIFGNVKSLEIHRYHHDSAAGILFLEKAEVKWFLSINADHLEGDQKVFRGIEIENEKLDFTTGFNNLHIESYKQIIAEKGFYTSEVKESIDLIHKIRKAKICYNKENAHNLANLPLSKHPFE